MIIKIIAFLIILFSFAYLWVQRRFRFWKDRGFHQGNPSFPMGTLKDAGTKMNTAECIHKYYKEFKGKTQIVGLYNFLSPVLLPIDPELIKNILVRDFQSFHDRGFFHNKELDPTSANILTLDGQEWKDRRVKLSPIFTSGKMKMMFNLIDIISDKFIHVLDQEMLKTHALEMRGWSQRYTTDNIGNVAFGIDPNSLENDNSEFLYYGRRFINATMFETMQILFAIEFPKLARLLRIRFAPKEVGDYFLKTFTETIENRKKNQINRNDFVSLLLGLKDVYTTEELASEAFLMNIGGFETSSTVMTFTLYELALNQDVQDRLREEITAGIEENDGKMTYDMVFGFKYLDMVINEALRKYPPIPAAFRKCTKEYLIPGTKLVIPKGTAIIVSSFSLQRDSEYFPSPEKFDPERFSEENVKKINPFTNLPFGEGPRNCLGMRFGLMQSKIGIAKLVKNFIITPTEKTPFNLKFVPEVPFLAPVGGMWLKLTKIP